MRICEVIGILVVQCDRCSKKFVVNSEMVKDGFQCRCNCRPTPAGWVTNGSTLEINIRSHPLGNTKNFGNREAMPLEEYKRLLAGIIIEGKKPKVPPKHKSVIEININNAEYQNLYESLRQLGFSKEEAISKVDIAIKEGFIHETEIIKYILSLQ